MSRDVQAIVLLLVGAALLRITLTGEYLRYVKPAMQPYLIATAVLLLMLGIWALVDIARSYRAAGPPPSHTDDGTHTETHDHGGMRVAWLLVLPVVSILVIAPPALGSFTAQRESSTVAAPAAGDLFEPLPPGDPVPITLNEYALRAVWGGEHTLAGRRVALIGFVTPSTGSSTDPANAPWDLARLSMACCAADAKATKIAAIDAPPLPDNTWVRLTGTWIPGGPTDSSTAVPWIQVDSVRRIPSPAEPYE